MNYEQFAIWLHGFLEISNAESIDQNQTQIIKDHLALLFEKKTPDRSEKNKSDVSEELLALLFEKKTPDRSEKNKSDVSEELKEKYSEFHVPCFNPRHYPVPPPVTCDVDLNTKFDTELHKNKTYC